MPFHKAFGRLEWAYKKDENSYDDKYFIDILEYSISIKIRHGYNSQGYSYYMYYTREVSKNGKILRNWDYTFSVDEKDIETEGREGFKKRYKIWKGLKKLFF